MSDQNSLPVRERREAVISRVMNLATVFLSATDPAQLLRLIVDSACSVMDAEAGSLALLEPDGRTLRFISAAGPTADVIRGQRQPLTRGLLGWVVRTGVYLISNDPYNDPRFDPSFDQKSGFRTRSYLCMPIRTPEGEIIGALLVLNRRNSDFTDWDAQALQAFTNLAAAALRTFDRSVLTTICDSPPSDTGSTIPSDHARNTTTLFRPVLEDTLRPPVRTEADGLLVASFQDAAPHNPHLFRGVANLRRGETVVYAGRFAPAAPITPPVLSAVAADIHSLIEGCLSAGSHLPRIHNYLVSRFGGNLRIHWAALTIPPGPESATGAVAGQGTAILADGTPVPPQPSSPPLGGDDFQPAPGKIEPDQTIALIATDPAADLPRTFSEMRATEWFSNHASTPDPLDDLFAGVRMALQGELLLLGVVRGKRAALCADHTLTPDPEEGAPLKQIILDACDRLDLPPQRQVLAAAAVVRFFLEWIENPAVHNTPRIDLHLWSSGAGTVALTFRAKAAQGNEDALLPRSPLLERLSGQIGMQISRLPARDKIRVRLVLPLETG